MTDEQVRQLFSVAVDGELQGAEREAFEAHLQAHPALAEEFSTFRQMVDDTHALRTGVVVPDLLPGVQRKLRRRRLRGMEHLRGRGFPTTFTLSLIIAAVAALIWLALSLVAKFSGEFDALPGGPVDAPASQAGENQ